MPSEGLRQNRRSIRLREFNYSTAGAYFVTVCTDHRQQIFGRIVGEEMRLNALGRAVQDCWVAIPEHFSGATLDVFVVMPNHVHGIIWIADVGETPPGRGTACRAPTRERFSAPVAGSLPTIVRSFKSAATKRINEFRGTPGDPVWQKNYYEHVIRDERALDRIRNYVVNNPAKWQFDRENPDALKPERPNAWRFDA